MKYKIKSGDTLSQLALDNKTTVAAIAKANGIEDVDFIRTGDIIEIPSAKKEKKKSSSVEKVIPQKKPVEKAKEKIKKKVKDKPKDKPKERDRTIMSYSGIPINIRQMFDPYGDITEADLSDEEYQAFKDTVKAAQDRGSEQIEYEDYKTQEKGESQYADVSSAQGLRGFFQNLRRPEYAAKTTVGQAQFSVDPVTGETVITDQFNFNDATSDEYRSKNFGLNNLGSFLSSAIDGGFGYNLPRRFAKYYGPQEGEGGNINIKYAQGGQMNINDQVQNIASKGRFGDTMLMHVNPQEVRGLAQAMPLTVNPETGQPEAFLPFLAPLLGGWMGSALLGAGTAAGLGTAAATGIGAGLAQTAVTGSLKEGLKAGLMAGAGSAIFGGGSDLQVGTDALTTPTTSLGIDPATGTAFTPTSALQADATRNLIAQNPNVANPIAQGATQAGTSIPQTLNPLGEAQLAGYMKGPEATNYLNTFSDKAISNFGEVGGNPTNLEAFKSTFSEGPMQGFKNLGTSAMNNPAALAAAGTSGTMYSMDMMEAQQAEAYEQYLAEREEEERQNELMNPEPILYSANGGLTQFDDNMNEMYGPMQPMANGGQTEFFPGGATFADVGPDDITYGELPQIFAPARTAYDVNPDFMPGFAPETMYFNPATVSAPASSLTAGAAPTVEDTYTGSKGGYGGTQVSIAPQTSINPFEAYTGVAPEGLVYSQPAPPLITPEPPLTTPVTPDVPVVVEPDPVVTEPEGEFNIPNIDIPNIGNIDIPSFGGMSVLDQINLYGLNNDTPNLDLLSDNNLLPNLDLLPDNNLNIGNTNFVPNLDFLSDNNFVPDLDSSPANNLDIGGSNFVPNLDLLPANSLLPDNNLGFADFKPQDFNVSMSRAEGGPTNIEEMQNDPLTKEVALYLLGQSNDEKSLNLFLEKYGNEAFMKLREMVLQTVAPNSQTEGLIAGAGNGGMDDDISGTIGNKQEIAVSQDEFIVPADVVSMLGDGSSDAGSKQLYDMMDRVRQEKTGTTEQAPKLANAGGLLPA